MSVDISKVRRGDELTVRVKVHEVTGGGVAIRSLHHDRDHLLKVEHIVAHHPKALSVGDRVLNTNGRPPGEILAVVGAEAWVKWPYGQAIHLLSSLERVDA